MIADRREAIYRSGREGLAIAISLLASTGLCFVAPSYFDATNRQRTIWLFCGASLAVVGSLVGVVQIDRMRGKRVISDLGFAVLIFIVAIATAVLAEKGSFGPWVKGELKTMALLECAVAVWALSRATLLRQSRRREAELPWRHRAGISQRTALSAGALGVIAGILTLIGAVLGLWKI